MLKYIGEVFVEYFVHLLSNSIVLVLHFLLKSSNQQFFLFLSAGDVNLRSKLDSSTKYNEKCQAVDVSSSNLLFFYQTFQIFLFNHLFQLSQGNNKSRVKKILILLVFIY